jgi:hypothetical protein
VQAQAQLFFAQVRQNSKPSGGAPMIRKWNVPMKHRVALFFALNYTAIPLLRLAEGRPLKELDLFAAILFWAVVAYHWHERKTPGWRLKTADGYGSTPLDLLYQRFDRLPGSIKLTYWLLIVLAALLIYWLVPAR